MHHHSRRLTPHPAGLFSVIATLFVVLAAFLAAADPCTSSSSPVAARSTPRRVRMVRDVVPPPPSDGAPTAGMDARAAVSDSIRGADDGCAEHGEMRRKVGGRSDQRSSGSAPTLLDSPSALSRVKRSAAPTLRGRVAPSPVVPRAPPVR